MTSQHPITPPDELVQQWRKQAPRYRDGGVGREYWLMARAAQWGADQELEACCEWLKTRHWIEHGFADELHAARRPKPQSLKEQAFSDLADAYDADKIDDTTYENIRLALEALPDG